MHTSLNMRKFFLTMVLIVGLIAVAVPVCQMVACAMSADGMPFSSTPIVKGVCDSLSMHATGPAGSVPPSSESLLLILMGGLAAMVVLLDPPRALVGAVAFASDPPTPPEDPRGVRLLL